LLVSACFGKTAKASNEYPCPAAGITALSRRLMRERSSLALLYPAFPC
jgi:hypothetical protein